MYMPFNNPGTDNMFARHYTNAVPEHDLVFDGFYDKDHQTGQLIPHGAVQHMTMPQGEMSPHNPHAQRGIESDGGLHPYDWTDKDTAADMIVDLNSPVMMNPSAMHSSHEHHNPQHHPSQEEGAFPEEGTSPIDQNGSIIGSDWGSTAWWKIALILIFISMAAFFWLKIIETIISMTVYGRLSNLIVNVVLAIVFTFIALLILWMNR